MNGFGEFDVPIVREMFISVLEKLGSEGGTFRDAFLFDYLSGACEVVDSAEYLGIPGVDLSVVCYEKVAFIMLFLYAELLSEDMDPVSARRELESFISGYLFFCFYNRLFENGSDPEIHADRKAGRLVLYARRNSGEVTGFDVVREVRKMRNEFVYEGFEHAGEVSGPLRLLVGIFEERFGL
ncbi:MAG: hypothetical protein J5685_09390 [Clostridiales bacterium]|nr:hypothetical protein [Clostridiales bacterium]